MIFRYILFFIFLSFQTSIFAQNVEWNATKRGHGYLTFDDPDAVSLFIDFDTLRVDYEELHVQLKEILDKSGLKYELISKSQLEDARYSDLNKYPLVLDQNFYTSTGTNGMTYRFLGILVIERKTNRDGHAGLTARSTKYCSAYKSLSRMIKKGKPVRVREDY